MQKALSQVIKKIVENSLKANANSTTSYLCFQPEIPIKLKEYSKNANSIRQ